MDMDMVIPVLVKFDNIRFIKIPKNTKKLTQLSSLVSK